MSARRAAVVGAILLAFAATMDAANRYDPRLSFRAIATPRFVIYFHQGEEPMARRLARIAEEVADRLGGALGSPRGRVHVILVNQTDLTNGWATPAPYNLIELNTVPPPGASTIGNTDDWLRLVFSHEYTHIVHLDASRGWIGGLQHVFGRHAVLLPNLFLPQWQIEGIATFEESALTGQGRVPAGDFRMLLDEASMARRFDAIDRTGGGLVDWPGGNGSYLYGAYFHEYLADRFGAASLARLSNDTAGRLPFFGAPAFRKIFGESLGDLWNDFERDTRAHASAGENRGTRLTHHGFAVDSPRFGPDGRLFYSLSDPHRFPALLELAQGRSRARRVTTRYLGSQTSTSGGIVVFDQLEFVRSVALQSDLYAVSVEGGHTRRLTRGARAAAPDVAPDGRTIVCTVQGIDRRELATLTLPPQGSLASPVVVVSDPSTEFSSPRWSPDGRTIVAERRRLGGPSEIVVIDPATHEVTRIASAARGRMISPEWLTDGRSILFASDQDGHGFAIYEVTIATGVVRRLLGTGSDARSPTLSPDGRSLVFVGYTPDGRDLFSLPIEAAEWRVENGAISAAQGAISATESAIGATQSATSATQSAVSATASATGAGSAAYRPWRTLAPRFWTPTVEGDAGETRIGGATFGADALGRHSYNATIGWAASRARPDWQIAYAYDRWRPTLFVDVSDDVDPWRTGELRSTAANAGALFPIRHVRRSSTLLAALHASDDAFECASCQAPVDTTVNRRAIRVGWHFDASHEYGYSISPEDGATFSVTSEFDRRALGATGDAGAATVDVRGYRQAFLRHAVIAARIAGATSWGDPTTRRQFTVTGSGPPPPAFAFGSDAIGLLRGFDDAPPVGTHAAVANLDYRFLVADVQRGMGTLPFFLRAVHAAVFADAGHAWSHTFRSSDLRTSVGAELSFDTVIGFTLPVTLTSGAAWRDDPARVGRDFVAFGRIGRAF